MDAPNFNSNGTVPQPLQSPEDATDLAIAPEPRVIESASASTACQTTSSKFAYILTASVLGITALLAIALTFLAFSIVQTAIDAYEDSSWDAEHFDYPDGYDFDGHGHDYDYDFDFDYDGDFNFDDEKYLRELEEIKNEVAERSSVSA